MGYKTQSADTPRSIEERQSAFFRRLGLNGRLACGADILDEGFEALWAQLRRDFPNLSPKELKIEWVRRHYGEDMARRYEGHLLG